MSIRTRDQQLVDHLDSYRLHLAESIRSPISANVGPALDQMLSTLELLDERARLLVDRKGMVLAAGSSAAGRLVLSDCLSLDQHKLRPATREAQASLDTLLSTAKGELRTEILPRQRHDGHCILCAAGLCGQTVMLTVQIAHDDFVPSHANLEVAFGLTPSEAEIVQLLQRGRCPKEIALELGISVHTVRAHLRHSYDKLGVSSREGLACRLAPYRLN